MRKRSTATYGSLLDAMESVGSTPVRDEASVHAASMQYISIQQLKPGKWQPRQKIDQTALEELAASIREQGVFQPVIVRSSDNDSYEIIAGERRWRAAQIAKLREIPVIVRDDVDDKKAALIALLENIQREDLNLIERARGYKQITYEYGLNQKELSTQLGLSASQTGRIMALLTLPVEIHDAVESGDIEGSVAIELLALKNEPNKLKKVAKHAQQKGLSVKQVRTIISQQKDQKVNKRGRPRSYDGLRDLQLKLSKKLGVGVSIRYNEKTDRGSITVNFVSLGAAKKVLEKALG